MGRIKEYYHEIIMDGQITDIDDANRFMASLGGNDAISLYTPEQLGDIIRRWKTENGKLKKIKPNRV